MSTRTKGLTALFALTALVAGCGGSGSGAPDVSGGAASDSATLFKASNLTKVLAQAKSQLGGTPITLLKIEPRDVKVIGQNKTVTVDASGSAAVISTPSIPGQASFDLSVVSPATVEKVVSAVESKSGLKQSAIGYVVYPVSANGHYQANINGANLKSIGGSGGATPASGAPGSGGSPAGGAAPSGGSVNPQAIANCVSKAGGDPAKIAACSNG